MRFEFNVGDKVLFGKEKRVVVGIFGDAFVFANLKPKNLDEKIVLIYEDSEIEELLENGDMKLLPKE